MANLKRPLSLLLSVLLVSGTFLTTPVTAYADESDSGSETQEPVKKTYTMTWYRDDGFKYGETKVTEGDIPTFPDSSWSLTKNGNSVVSYEFSHFEPELGPATQDVTYTAIFAEKFNHEGVIAAGTCSKSDSEIFWEVYESGVLSITVSGSYNNNFDANYQPWSDYNDKITEIQIHGRVGEIPEGAFRNMKNVTKVEFQLYSYSNPGGYYSYAVKNIGKGAFEGCESLESVIIPTAYTSSGLVIDENAFKNCTNLKNMSFPGMLSYIGEYAFMNCSSLESAVLPDSVTTLSTGAFSGCTKLKNVRLPSDLQGISTAAFGGCTSLTQVSVPEGVGGVNDNAFMGCTSLTDVYLYADPKRDFGGFPLSDNSFPESTLVHVPAEYRAAYNELYPSLHYGRNNEDEVKTWYQLKTLLENGTNVKLEYDITAEPGDETIILGTPPTDFVPVDDYGGVVIPNEETIDLDVTLDLNGHTINRNAIVGSDDSSDDGYYSRSAMYSESAFYNNTKFTITDTSEAKSGVITGAAGGAVCNDMNGDFTLLGGTIKGNVSQIGAGVTNYGVMMMKGGTITENTAYATTNYDYTSGGNGGGIYNHGVLYIIDGNITKNKAETSGGGIYNDEGTLILRNVNITGNNCAENGGGLYTNNVVEISWKPVILNNTKNDTIANDTYLTESTSYGVNEITSGAFKFTDKIYSGAKIGVYDTAPRVLTEDFAIAQTTADLFVSNNEALEVRELQGEVSLNYAKFETWADLKSLIENYDDESSDINILLPKNFEALDNDEDITIDNGKNVSIDLGGSRLVTNSKRFIIKDDYSSLTIDDSIGDGKVTTADNEIAQIFGSSSVYIDGGSFYGPSNGAPLLVVDDSCTGNVDMGGGFVRCSAGSFVNTGDSSATISVRGGVVSCESDSETLAYSSAIVTGENFAGRISVGKEGTIITKNGAGIYVRNAAKTKLNSRQYGVVLSYGNIHSENSYGVYAEYGDYEIVGDQFMDITGGKGGIYLADGMKIRVQYSYAEDNGDAIHQTSIVMENPGYFTSGFNTAFPSLDAGEVFTSADGNYVVAYDGYDGFLKQGVTSWSELQAAFNEKSEGTKSIVLGDDVTAGEDDTDLEVPANTSVILNLNGHTLDRNAAEGKSGRAIINYGSLTVRDTSFNKTGTITGGKVTESTTYTKVINNLNYTINIGANGGAIYNCPGSTLRFESGNITGNEAAGEGGAIYADGGQARSDMRNSSNKFEYYYLDVASLTISGGVISGNKADKGGAVSTHSYLTISGGVFENNEALTDGGAVYVDNYHVYYYNGTNKSMGRTAYLKGGEIKSNKAGSNGGGIWTIGDLDMSGGVISFNEAGGNGGGVFSGQNVYNTKFSNVTITDNTAGGHGGVYVSHSSTNNSTKSNYVSNIKILAATVVTDNQCTDGTTENVYLEYGAKLDLGGMLSDGAKIGLSYADTSEEVAVVQNSIGYYSNTANRLEMFNKYFSFDDGKNGYEVYVDSTKVSNFVRRKTYFVGSQVLADRDIGLKVTFCLHEAKDKQCEVRFTWGDENTKSYKGEGIPNVVASLTPDEDGCCSAEIRVAAKEILDTIKMEIYADGELLASRNTSVEENLNLIVNGSDYTEAQINFAQALLAYGSASTAYFSTDESAVTTDAVQVWQSDKFEYEETPVSEDTYADELSKVGLTFYGSSLKLRHKTAYTLYFTAESTDGLTATAGGKAVSIRKSNIENIVFIDIENIAFEDLTKNNEVTFEKGGETATISCNPGTYIEAYWFEQDESSNYTELSNAMYALYAVNRYAIDLLNSQEGE